MGRSSDEAAVRWGGRSDGGGRRRPAVGGRRPDVGGCRCRWWPSQWAGEYDQPDFPPPGARARRPSARGAARRRLHRRRSARPARRPRLRGARPQRDRARPARHRRRHPAGDPRPALPAPGAGRARPAAAALPLDEAVADGWAVREDDTVRATVDVRPYGGPDGEDWFIVSDLGCAVGGAGGIGKKDEGVVLGVGGASTTLAGITVRTPVSAALDLGTGSGIQALHAAQHATRVTATDLNPRALDFTRLTLALSGAAEAELVAGSLFEPVGDDTYDLIVSNPPFVISPAPDSPTGTAGWAATTCAARSCSRRASGSMTAGTPSSSPTGSTWTARSGRSGCGPGCRAAATPGSCSGRSRTSPSTPSCGCGTAATTGATRPPTGPRTPAGSTSSRPARRGRSASAGSRSGGTERWPPAPSSPRS